MFDAGLPPALAFIRSLGSCAVPITTYSSHRAAAGRFSRFVVERRECPPRLDSVEFVDWLTAEIGSGDIDLIAPTSDALAFAVGEAMDRLGRPATDVGLPPADAIRTCLFKGRFAEALASLDFPTPPAAIPRSLDEALSAAERIGYPVMLKPRSHVGIGSHRGRVVSSREELTASYRHYRIAAEQEMALRHVPHLALPIVQRYFGPGTVDVVSITGCLDRDGEALAVSGSRKLRQLPRRFGVGTLFEPIPLPAFTEQALDMVRSVLQQGIFELEVLIDQDGRQYAIDLNPRGFGQITLDMARGRDLPKLWYRSVSGVALPAERAERPPPQFWQDAVPLYADVLVRVAREPSRRALVRRELRRIGRPRVGVAFDRRDPIPGVLFGLSHLRHPRAFVRRLLTDVEGPGASEAFSCA